MRYFDGLGSACRPLPSGSLKLLALAMLLSMAVFGTRADAGETISSITAPETTITTSYTDAGDGIVIGPNGGTTVNVEIKEGGSITSTNGVTIQGKTTVSGNQLLVGNAEANVVGKAEEYLYSSTYLNRASESAVLHFDDVIIYQSTDVHSFNLGAVGTITGDDEETFYNGGIIVGTVADNAETTKDPVALYTNSLTTTSHQYKSNDGRNYYESTVYVLGDVILADGGTITLDGHINDGSGGISGQKYSTLQEKALDNTFTGTFRMQNGGTLDMTSLHGASIVMKNIDISGGTATLSADKLVNNSSWLGAPSIVGGAIGDGTAGTFSISGGTINLGDYGTLRTYSDQRGTTAAEIVISGGTIFMDGSKDKASVILARDADDAERTTSGKVSKLHIDNDAVIDVTGNGVILSRYTDFSGGEINVSGELTVAGAAATSMKIENTNLVYTYDSVLNGIDGAAAKWGDFNFKGGTMTVADGGIVDFVSGNMTVTANKGNLNGTLFISDIVGTESGVYANNLTVNGAFTVTNLDISLDAKNTDSAGVTVNGSLVVTDNVSAGDGANGLLAINPKASLTANSDSFVTLNFNNKTITQDEWSNLDSFSNLVGFEVDKDLVNALDADEGTLYLAYSDSNNGTMYSITSAELEKLREELGVGNLVLSGVITGDQTTVITDNDGKVADKITNPSVTVTVDTPAGYDKDEIRFENEVVVKDIAVADENVDELVFGKDITFLGSDNKNDHLIDIAGDKPGDLTAEANLTLGIPGLSADKGGVLGDITFNGKGQDVQNFTVNEGDFTVGTVTSTDKSGDVNIKVINARLATDTIDLTKVDNTKYKTTVLVDKKGTLTINGDLRLNDNANSSITLDNNSLLTVNNISGAKIIDVENGSTLTATGSITMTDNSKLTVDGGSTLAANTITMGEQSVMTIGNGTVTADRLEMGAGSLINACHTETAGSFVLTEAKLGGGTIFTDPAWRDGVNPPNNATALVISKFDTTPNLTDGNLIIGQNSHFTFGRGDYNWIVECINEAGQWGPTGQHSITAAAGLYKPMVLGNNTSLIVDGNITANDAGQPARNGTVVTPSGTTTAEFAANSLLVVNAAAIGANQAALSTQNNTGTLKVDAGAKLYVDGGKAGQVFTLVDGFTTINGSGVIGDTAWNTEQNLTNSAMTNVVLSINSNLLGYTASITSNNAEDIYKNSSGGSSGIINEIYRPGPGGIGLNDNDSSNAGIRFVSRATDKDWNGTNLDVHIATIEGAAQLASVGGAQMQAFNIMRMSQDAIRQRFSFSNGLIPHPDGSCKHPSDAATAFSSDDALGAMFNMNRFNVEGKKIVSVWASPVYQRNRVSGTKVGNFDNSYRTNLGGANFGVDFDLGNNYRFGIAGDFGGGKAKTKESIFARTENKIDWAGISAYGGWSTCNLSILVDGGYDRITNKLSQDNWLGGVRNHGKMKANAWNLGVTAEYLVVLGKFDLVPHAGLRYEGLGSNSYTVRDNFGDLFNVGSDTQHVLSIPVGVSFSRDFNVGCKWRITPYADLGAIFSVGNRDYKTSVSIPTLSGHGFRSRVLDAAAFDGKAGVNVDRGRFSGGVNYNLTASGNQTSHSLWATLGLNF